MAEGSPHDVDPNDFAMSTFNAPGSAVASAYGFGGANLIFLGATGGLAAIDEATRQITSGRAQRVLAGAYEEVTPYFRRLMRGLGEPAVEEAVALLTLEDEATSQGRGITPLARILGAASRAPGGRWPGAPNSAPRCALLCHVPAWSPTTSAPQYSTHTFTRSMSSAKLSWPVRQRRDTHQPRSRLRQLPGRVDTACSQRRRRIGPPRLLARWRCGSRKRIVWPWKARHDHRLRPDVGLCGACG